MKRFIEAFFTVILLSLFFAVDTHAVDYFFSSSGTQDYYPSTSYEDIYGSQYHYGGANVVDYQDAVLLYGNPSTTQIGVMERTILPSLQQAVSTGGGGYGVTDHAPVTVLPEIGPAVNPIIPNMPYQQPAYTSVEGMAYKDGSIGTIKIPSLNISMKVWEGETAESMKKGLGHYSSTSAWNGNVAVCGHNRGAQYVIGSIKDLKQGDTITYTTIYGTRTYQVTTVQIIANTDWSYLQTTADNRLTLTTCLANHPESRVCVQAIEV